MKAKVKVVVSGVRAAGALIETVPVKLKKNSDGDLAGSTPDKIDITDPVTAVISMAGEPTDDFVITITVDDLGTATRKGTLNDDLVVRRYDLPFSSFK